MSTGTPNMPAPGISKVAGGWPHELQDAAAEAFQMHIPLHWLSCDVPGISVRCKAHHVVHDVVSQWPA